MKGSGVNFQLVQAVSQKPVKVGKIWIQKIIDFIAETLLQSLLASILIHFGAIFI